jgi:glycosyltransferase involved in cell wall biosynthesis
MINHSFSANITVCLLTYNHIELIPSCLDSILNQTLENFEFIISDDCSTDGTWEYLVKIASVYKNIKLLRPDTNLGMSGNANFAISHCNTEFIAMLHHDDIYDPNLLKDWFSIISKSPDIGFVFNSYGIENSTHIYSCPIPEVIDGHVFLENYLFPFWGSPVRGTSMLRKSAIELVGGFREKFSFLSDIDLYMRISRFFKVGYCNKPLICMRIQRPDYYPADYDLYSFSWNRIKLLHNIHAQNRLEYYSNSRIKNYLKWNIFRFRLNFDTLKWLIYLVYKKKFNLLVDIGSSGTNHEYSAVLLLRIFLRKFSIKLGLYKR